MLEICAFQVLVFKPSPFAKSWLPAYRRRFQIFHPTIFLSHKNFLFGKFLMTSLHVSCDLGLLVSSNQNSGYANELEITYPWPRNWPRALCPRLHLCYLVTSNNQTAVISKASRA